MKVIKYFFLIICFFNSLYGLAQNFEWADRLPRKDTPTDTLDYAHLCVHYRQLVRKDTLKPNDQTSSEMILQIGDRISNYTNWIRLQSDSIVSYELKFTGKNMSDIIRNSVAREKNSGDKSTVFKNYPTGKYLTQSRVFLDRYLYEESLPVFGWKLQPGESGWLGYKCRKATCTFRGRDYIAWYAPAIPINNGPWKFSGLPGLILRVEDSRGDYVFDAVSIYKVTWKRPIYLAKRSGEFKTTREKFLKAERNGFANPAALIQSTGKIQNMPAIKKKFPYNPIELE